MKGFIAVCLASIPKIKRCNPENPVHFAFSYDEEVGCIGVRELLKSLSAFKIKPAMCLVGEPTDLRVIRGHKGGWEHVVTSKVNPVTQARPTAGSMP